MQIDAIIPVLLTNKTTMIWMFDWDANHFYDLTPDWGDYRPLEARSKTPEIPLRIHMGDFDQDGYVDGLVVVEKKNAGVDATKEVKLL